MMARRAGVGAGSRLPQSLRILLGALWLLSPALGGCSSSPSPVEPTPAPTVAPTPVPTPLVCSPTPPPLHGFRGGVHNDQGWKKVLDVTPLVKDANYCAAIGRAPENICPVRSEGDPQLEACQALAFGLADTGRYGPTWTWNGQPCRPVFTGGDQAGCKNHEKNQFQAYAFGPGDYRACGPGQCYQIIVP